jgi:peptide/nickel transport system substrate-binding protein
MRTLRSKRLVGLVAVAAASLLVATACGSGGGNQQQGNQQQYSPGFAECLSKPNDCNSGPRKAGGTLVFAVEQDMASWHISSSDGTHFSSSQMLSGLIPGPFNAWPDLTYHMNTDLMVSAEPTSTSPFTVVYKIRPEAIWSDDTPISVEDFLYNWYTFAGEKGPCPDCTPASTTGYDLIQSITGADNGKTVTVVFSEAFPDWKSLFGLYPAHIAKSKGGWNGDKSDAAGLAKSFKYFIETQPDFSGGPYLIESYQKGVGLTEVPNPKWYGKEKPTLEKLVWRLVEQQSELVPAMRNNEIQANQAQPSQQLVQQLSELSNVQYQLSLGLQWEHFDLNTKNKHLADKVLRQAIFTATDRKEIIDKTVALFDKNSKPLDHHVFMNGQKGYQDNVKDTGQGSGNVDAAKKLLTDAGYKYDGDKLLGKDNQPISLRFRHTVGNTLRANTALIYQNQLKKIGIDLKIETTDSLSQTLDTGDYDIMIFAWVGTPAFGTTQKDLWSSKSGQNYNGYNNPEYDAIAEEVAKTVDEAKAIELINKADKILMADAITLPLFQKPAMVAVTKDFVNVRGNPTNAGVAYNNQEWGLKQAA